MEVEEEVEVELELELELEDDEALIDEAEEATCKNKSGASVWKLTRYS